MKKYIASCSCGKDSVAMIELIIEKGLSLDEIVFAKLEKEFKQENEFRKILIDRWETIGYKCIILETNDTWDNWFFGEVTRGENKGYKRGFPLTAFSCWWSREAKFKILEEYMKGHIRYIGIASDEPNRYHPEKYDEGYRYPLCEWGITEKECRKLCVNRNILNPLYKYFNRLGCYLCPKQNKKSLYSLAKYFPEEWEELKLYMKKCQTDDFISHKFNTNIETYDELLAIEKMARNQLDMFKKID